MVVTACGGGEMVVVAVAVKTAVGVRDNAYGTWRSTKGGWSGGDSGGGSGDDGSGNDVVGVATVVLEW